MKECRGLVEYMEDCRTWNKLAETFNWIKGSCLECHDEADKAFLHSQEHVRISLRSETALDRNAETRHQSIPQLLNFELGSKVARRSEDVRLDDEKPRDLLGERRQRC